MRDKNILITGGTDGMGKATAHQLAKLGANLLLIGRNQTKGEAAAAEIIQASGNSSVAYLQADLSLVHNLPPLAEQVRQRFDHLDVLVHCAGGVFPSRRTLTSEGVELSFAVQYLARHVLTQTLLDRLCASPRPQVLCLAGGGAGHKPLDMDNLMGEKRYSIMGAVQTSSVTNNLLTLDWIEHYPGITFYNYGPGFVRTGMIDRSPLPIRLMLNTVGRLFSRSPYQAATVIVGLLTGDLPGGFYEVGLRKNELSLDPATRAAFRLHTESLITRLAA